MNVDRTGSIPRDSAEDGEISDLAEVTARIERTLRPVQPAPVFRARLRDGLRMAAHHQEAHRLLAERTGAPVEFPQTIRGPWGWLIGAAALGSAASVIAMVMRSRAQTHKPAVQPQPQQ